MPGRLALQIAWIAGALAPWWLACAEEPAPVRADGPNVLIYLVDTLRRDHLGVYGYERDTSPRLDAFARDAIVFENSYAPSSWTRPSAASLLTGLAPSRHRVIGRLDVLSGDTPLLSEHFQEAGYHTLAFVTNPNVISLWGFDRGFDHFEDVDSASLATGADAVIDRVTRSLDALPTDEPFFLYVHTLDPHEPYDPPRSYRGRFAGAGSEDVGLYDAEIAFGDFHFGELLDHLRERGQYDDTLVVFVSDHGEEFREHGGTSHGHTLFEEVVQIPMLIKLPANRRGGERLPGMATLMDVAPTLLAALGQPVPPGLDGLDLLSGAPGTGTPERPLFLDLELDWHRGRTDAVRAVRIGDQKYLRRLRPEAGEQLFDLAADPSETNDLHTSAPERVAQLAALLDAYVSARSTGFHLILRQGPWDADRRCRAKLETTGRFVHFATRLLEEGDRAELADNGRSLEVDVALHNYPHPTGAIPRVIIDEDALRFDVEPPDAAIELVGLPDGEHPPCPLWLGASHAPVDGGRLSFGTGREDLAVRDLSGLLRAEGTRNDGLPQGVYLAVVREADARTEVPEEVRERLRELGYAD